MYFSKIYLVTGYEQSDYDYLSVNKIYNSLYDITDNSYSLFYAPYSDMIRMESYYYTTLKEKSKEGFEDMICQAGQVTRIDIIFFIVTLLYMIRW